MPTQSRNYTASSSAPLEKSDLRHSATLDSIPTSPKYPAASSSPTTGPAEPIVLSAVSGGDYVKDLMDLQEKNQKLNVTLETLRSKAKQKIQELQDSNLELQSQNSELQLMRAQDVKVTDDLKRRLLDLEQNHSADMDGLHSTVNALQIELRKSAVEAGHLDTLKRELALKDSQLEEMAKHSAASVHTEALEKLKLDVAARDEQLVKLKGSQVLLQKQVAHLESTTQNLKQELTVKDSEISKLAQVNGSTASPDAHVDSLLERIAAKDLQISQLSESHASLKQQFEKLQNEELLQLRDTLTAREAQIVKLGEQYQEAQQQLESNSGAGEQLQTLSEQLVERNQQLDELVKQNELLKRSLSADVQNDEELEKLRAELVKKDGELDRLRESHNLLQEAQMQLAQVKNELYNSTTRLEQLQQSATAEPSNSAEMEALKEQLDEYRRGTAGKDQKIQELMTQLDQLTSQKAKLSVSSTRVAELEETLMERNEFVTALERQIEGLHKVNAQNRIKDAEISKLNGALSDRESSLTSTQKKLESNESLLSTRNETIEQLKGFVKELEATHAGQIQKMTENWKALESKSESLKQTAEQSEKLLLQQAQLRNDLHQKDEEIIMLTSNLESLNEELKQNRDLGVDLERGSKELEAANSRVGALEVQLVDAQRQIDETRSEFAFKENELNNLKLELDHYREENATMLASHTRELERISKDLQSKQQEIRAANSELSTFRQTNEGLQIARQNLEKQLQDTRQSFEQSITDLDRGKKTWDAEKSLLEQDIARLKESYRLKETELQVSRAGEHHSSATPQNLKAKDLEQLQLEWRDKYRILEQENLRLRDRSLRAERVMNDLDRSRTGDGSSALGKSPSQFMQGVATIPWLATKEEDEVDLEAPRGLTSNASGRGAQLRHVARGMARRVLRMVDQESVRLGLLMRENPMARLGVSVYTVVLHVVIVALAFSALFRGSSNAPVISHDD